MKKTSVFYVCDIDGCGCQGNEVEIKPVRVSVIFTTEQTEGRSTQPYLEVKDLELCPQHLHGLMAGMMIFAHGAQGYNKYYFQEGVIHNIGVRKIPEGQLREVIEQKSKQLVEEVISFIKLHQ